MKANRIRHLIGRGLFAMAFAALLLPRIAESAAPGFVAPQPETAALENGLRIAVFPNADAGIVQVQLLIPAGMAAEGPGENGLANFTAQMVRRGTASRSGARFARDIAEYGTTWTVTAQRDYSVHAIAFLPEDLDAGLALFAGAVQAPGLQDEELGRAQYEITRALLELHRNVAATADEQVWPHAFPGHPYARPLGGTVPSVMGLGADAVKRFHERFYRPAGAVLAFAGNVTLERATALARAHFGTWEGRAESVPALALTMHGREARVVIVDLPSGGRSDIRVIIPAPERGSRSYLPFATLGRLLAEGATSRLGATVVPGSVGPVRHQYAALRDAGAFSIGGGAYTDSAGAMVEALRKALLDLVSAPPSDADIARLRTSSKRAHPFSIETPGALLTTWSDAQHYGPASPVLEGYASALDTLDATSLARTAAVWMLADRVTVLAVGPAEALRDQLARFGAAEVVTLDDMPQADWRTGEPTDEERARGAAIVARAVEVHGGAKALAGVRDSNVDYRVTAAVDKNEVQGNLRQLRKEPLKFRETTEILIYETTLVMDGNRGWFSSSNESQIQAADSLQLAQMRAAFVSDLPHLLIGASDKRTRLAHRGVERIDEHEADIVEAESPDGHRRWLLFDRASGYLVGFDVRGGIPPQVLARRTFGDFRTVGKLKWPYREDRYVQGRRMMQMEVQNVIINADLSDALFGPPGLTR